MAALEREFDYYVKHQEEIVEKYRDKFVVIVGESVVGAFDTQMEAFADASKKFEAGTFMIHRALPGEDNYTQTFVSNVVL